MLYYGICKCGMTLKKKKLENWRKEIKTFSKWKWLKKVKKACNNLGFENLLETQLEYSKGSNLNYGRLKCRSCLKSNNINAN